MSGSGEKTDVPAPEGPPAASLDVLRAEISRQAKATAEMDRAVAALAKQAARLDAAPRVVLDTLARVRELAAKTPGAPDLEPALAALDTSARAALDRAAARFGTALASALKDTLKSDLELRPMDSGYAYGAIRIRTDGAAGRLHVEYARQTVLKNVEPDPATVATAVATVLGDLEKPPFDPDVFLSRLNAAYRHSLVTTGKEAGELVDILVFWSHMAWEMQPEGFRREPASRRFRDYALHRFAHDLHRLREARRFEVEGRKLELEVAVHDRAYGKSLWVPEERTGGCYYQAIGLR